MPNKREWITCPTCNGQKDVWEPTWQKYFKCHECKGLGQVKRER